MEDCAACAQGGYTGRSCKDGGLPLGQGGVSVGGYSDRLPRCAALSPEGAGRHGRTYACFLRHRAACPGLFSKIGLQMQSQSACAPTDRAYSLHGLLLHEDR